MTSRALLCSLLLLLSLALLGRGMHALRPGICPYCHRPRIPSWDPACYSTLSQIETALQNTATQYPQLATLVDGGLGWENTRHLWALKLGSTRLPGPNPPSSCSAASTHAT